MKFFRFVSAALPPPPRPPRRPPAPPLAKSRPARPVLLRRSANSSNGTTIVGQWREPDATDTTEFRADGTVIEHTAAGDGIRGRYSLANDKLTVQLDGVAEELSFSVAFGPDSLEMTHADGQVTRYRRV
jgi:hypothetical protein